MSQQLTNTQLLKVGKSRRALLGTLLTDGSCATLMLYIGGCRYVGEKDLAFFKYHAVEDGPCDGASDWQLMMNKDIPGFVRYTSWRRTLPDGKTEYKSVTISPNATAREFSDMYLDDDFRRNWVSLVRCSDQCSTMSRRPFPVGASPLPVLWMACRLSASGQLQEFWWPA